MPIPPHLDPGLSETDRSERRAALRLQMADLPFEVSDAQIDNYIDAEYRLSGPTERLDTIGDVSVAPVGPADIDDVVAFFDHDAFSDKPEWAMCYCRCHHAASPEEWDDSTWHQNRADLVMGLRSGQMRGMIARVDGRVAGWLNCSDRASSPDHATGDDSGTASILCWSIAPPYRRHGLGLELLEGAIVHLGESGVKQVEGYAIESPSDDSSAYHGPLAIYTSCGFEKVGSSEHLVTVRRRT